MEIVSNNLYYKQEYSEVIVNDGNKNYHLIYRHSIEDNVEEKVLENLPDHLLPLEDVIINMLEHDKSTNV
jgi:hypothetical protein